MIVDSSTLLFFDTSCLIAAVGSPSGGSSLLLSLCARGLLKGAVSQPVLLEAERNITSKLGGEALNVLRRLVVLTPLEVVPVPLERERADYRSVVGDKDDHVLAAAIESGASFLVTLDKRLAERVNEASLTVRAMSPGDFIKTLLPSHVDYPTS